MDALKETAAKYEVEIVVRDSDNEYYKPTSLGSDGYKYVRKIVQSVFNYAVAVPFIPSCRNGCEKIYRTFRLGNQICSH